MLPPAHRLVRSADFASTMKRGGRARRGDLVVHHLGAAAFAESAPHAGAARVGLVVGRAVGGSVVRHRVSRRLRAQLARRVDLLPAGSTTVVRALPGAAAADSARLGRDLDSAFARIGLTGRSS